MRNPKKITASLHFATKLIALTTLLPGSAYSMEIYKDGETSVNAKVIAAFGFFSSKEKYSQTPNQTSGSARWQEATFQYGLDLKHSAQQYGNFYGSLNWVSSATWGDGDAAGWTLGNERSTKIEDAFVGWKSNDLFSAMGKDGVEISVGRQNIVVGDGFIISGDALNFGNGPLDGRINRGGAYYLTGRRNFDQTAVLRLGGAEGWRGDLMWLKSDNRAQAEPETFVGTLENIDANRTIGLTAVKVLDTDAEFGKILYPDRKNMEIYSIRAKGNAGVPGLFLAGEYADEKKKTASDESAWYLEAGWTFNDNKFTPKVNYRYGRFSEGYDPLFYGNGRELGTWFQGEVAGNYSGPFNSNSTIQQVGLKLSVTPSFNAGALLYKIDTLDKETLNLSGKELDIYGEWAFNDHLMVLPLIGLYKPDESAEHGGTQLGSNRTNLYAQVMLVTNF